jgi:hypothetical protein
MPALPRSSTKARYGLFQPFFKIREQDPDSAETTWAMEDNGSELVLDPKYAATLMTELSMDAAIASHGAGASSWKTWCMAARARCRGLSPFAGRPV